MKFIADTHIHSIASNHAYSTIMENIEAARQKGLVYMAMTEHGPKMPDAPHIWHCVNPVSYTHLEMFYEDEPS